jgi:uncharacterized protein YbjT (DUF2867 family)
VKIVVFGGTGGTGRNVLQRALAAGHDVVAVARRPDAIGEKADRLTVAKGDVLDPASFAPALAGADAVISCIGPASMRSPGTLLSEGVANLVRGCEEAGVRRFVYESGIIAGDGTEFGVVPRTMLRLVQTALGAFTAEKVRAEESVVRSGLDWVVVRPPGLAHTPATGAYRVGPKEPVALWKQLSHGDVADFLVRAATEPQHARQIVNIGH